MTKHTVTAENAAKFAEWIRSRGGIAIWRSINLSNPGGSWSTPALTLEGQSYPKPTWEAANTPEIITDANDILVSTDEMVKRFHVGVRMGSQGFMLKVTDGGTRRIRREVAKAGEGAYYTFDYECQDALIWKPVSTVPLPEWEKKQEVEKVQKSA
jgi:hypothetical protein